MQDCSASSTDYINAAVRLISAANQHDRYSLFEDPFIPLPNLDNSIHPIFDSCNFPDLIDNRNEGEHEPFPNNCLFYTDLVPVLRLASMFLGHDTMLEWFVRPAFGSEMTDYQTQRGYLAYSCHSNVEKRRRIDEVRGALMCLAHSITFRFTAFKNMAFAETRKNDLCCPTHEESCTRLFQYDGSTAVHIRKHFADFFFKRRHSCTLSERLRFDFSLAVTLVHEVTHAFGIMMRGHLLEPCIHQCDPKAEWGASWELFALGGIINPFDAKLESVSFLMRKDWLSEDAEQSRGGRYWDAVPVLWIGQWFQKSTWSAIKERGPSSVSPPRCGLKFRQQKIPTHVYSIIAIQQEALDDVLKLQVQVAEEHQKAAVVPWEEQFILKATRQLAGRKLMEIPASAKIATCAGILSSLVDRVTLTKCENGAIHPTISKTLVLKRPAASLETDSDNNKPSTDRHQQKKARIEAVSDRRRQ